MIWVAFCFSGFYLVLPIISPLYLTGSWFFSPHIFFGWLRLVFRTCEGLGKPPLFDSIYFETCRELSLALAGRQRRSGTWLCTAAARRRQLAGCCLGISILGASIPARGARGQTWKWEQPAAMEGGRHLGINGIVETATAPRVQYPKKTAPPGGTGGGEYIAGG
jgi:hypothetical protein